MDVSEPQSEKVISPMELTLAGMDIVVREVQERKAPSPRDWRPEPKLTEVRALHPPKASSPNETAPGIET
jgi:hypothetical protein